MFAAAVVGSFLVYLLIGLAVGRKVRSRADYYVAGRNAPTILITGSLVASFLSTVSFMGELGFSYDGYPVVLLILVAVNVSGYVLGVLVFGRYLRRSEALTVPEFFGRRFGSPALQAVAGVTVVLGIGAYLVAVTQGVSLVLSDLTGLGFRAALLLVWAGYTAFTFFSGSPGVLVTDTVMFFVFLFAGVLGMSYLVGAAGGPAATVSALAGVEGKPDIVSWHGLSGPNAYMGSPTEVLVWALVLGAVWATIVAISPWQSSRYLMAKNEHVCLRSGFLAMGAVLFLYVFLALGGAAINVFNPNVSPSELAFVWAAQNVLPTGLGVLVVTGIVAAGLSSASTFLSLIGFSAAHDIAPVLRRGGADPSTSLGFSRLVMLLAGLVVLGATYVAPPAVLAIGYFAATLFAASWGPVALLSIYSERITARGALFGMVSGFVAVSVLQGLTEFAGLSLPVWAHPVILGVLASLLGVLLGNLGARPEPAQLEFRRSLLPVPRGDLGPDRLKTTLRFGFSTAVLSVAVIVLLLVVYFVPFTQTLAAG
ncbi:Sodium:solute symporter family (plasmid) [Rubrobacter radiotolerans]|uniref:Sodium:solute symporter family n=1 Tax=Rubrobacter radiotolerans TaxID=42256 RepID=A0A023X821_RUBRA|nr:sodium:solute symporter family protein [Rubrobacter radiotolerans]AHY48214.1 Sodium:solute symporter family [Rubrobacter radiotolerans]MDX5895249.1 sodium:solute symporter family protein [Rubrobacter radiotolerans]SMC01879.1 sodium/pantothenate symporter [Rubrobacter radiotolerans DSM 5868]